MAVSITLDRLLSKEVWVATPAAISKLTEHATRAKSLMAKTDKAADQSGPILDQYDATLTRYMAALSEVKDQEKQLAAVLQGMGNATEIIAGAFQDEEPDPAKAPLNGTQAKLPPAPTLSPGGFPPPGGSSEHLIK